MSWSTEKLRYCCLGSLFLLVYICVSIKLYSQYGVDPIVKPHKSFLICGGLFVVLTFPVVLVGDWMKNLYITGFGAIAYIILAIVYLTLICVVWNGKDLTGGIQLVDEAWEHRNMDTIQTQYECCGKASAHDYIVINQPIPSSCYKNYTINDSKSIFTEGCSSKVDNIYRERMYELTIMVWVIFCTQILTVPATILLIIAIRNKKRRILNPLPSNHELMQQQCG